MEGIGIPIPAFHHCNYIMCHMHTAQWNAGIDTLHRNLCFLFFFHPYIHLKYYIFVTSILSTFTCACPRNYCMVVLEVDGGCVKKSP